MNSKYNNNIDTTVTIIRKFVNNNTIEVCNRRLSGIKSGANLIPSTMVFSGFLFEFFIQTNRIKRKYSIREFLFGD